PPSAVSPAAPDVAECRSSSTPVCGCRRPTPTSPRHGECAELLRRNRRDLVAPAPVVAETSWLLEDRLGPADEAHFLRLIVTGRLRVIDLGVEDYRRCLVLVERYADLGLGLVDASVVVTAENL